MSKTYHFRLNVDDIERLEKIRSKVQPEYVDLKDSDIMRLALRYYCDKEGLEGNDLFEGIPDLELAEGKKNGLDEK